MFTAAGLNDCVKHVKDADVARWTAGGLSVEDLPEMLDMVLENAGTRQQFAVGNMMLGAKLDLFEMPKENLLFGTESKSTEPCFPAVELR